MNSRLRLALLPFAVVLELMLLAGGWLLALIWPSRAARLSAWAIAKLPDKDWYFKSSTSCESN